MSRQVTTTGPTDPLAGRLMCLEPVQRLLSIGSTALKTVRACIALARETLNRLLTHSRSNETRRTYQELPDVIHIRVIDIT